MRLAQTPDIHSDTLPTRDSRLPTERSLACARKPRPTTHTGRSPTRTPDTHTLRTLPSPATRQHGFCRLKRQDNRSVHAPMSQCGRPARARKSPLRSSKSSLRMDQREPNAGAVRVKRRDSQTGGGEGSKGGKGLARLLGRVQYSMLCVMRPPSATAGAKRSRTPFPMSSTLTRVSAHRSPIPFQNCSAPPNAHRPSAPIVLARPSPPLTAPTNPTRPHAHRHPHSHIHLRLNTSISSLSISGCSRRKAGSMRCAKLRMNRRRHSRSVWA